MSGDSLYQNVVHLLQGTSYIDESISSNNFYMRGINISIPTVDNKSYFHYSDDTSQPVIYTNTTSASTINSNTDFEIDLDFILSSSSRGAALWSNRDSNGNGLLIGISALNQLYFSVTINGSIKVAFTHPIKLHNNVVYSITLERISGNFSFAINGTFASFGLTNAYYSGAINTGSIIYIGSDIALSSIIGYIRRYRLTIGGYRYSDNFTVDYSNYPTYISDNTISINVLNGYVTKANNNTKLTLSTINILSLSCVITDLNGNSLSDYSISTIYNTASNWTISIDAPIYTSKFMLTITGYSSTGHLGTSVKKSFILTNTTLGSLSEIESFVYNLGNLVSWLDFTDSSLMGISNGHLVKCIDKATGDTVNAYNPTLNTITISDFSLMSSLNLTTANISSLVYNTPIKLNQAFTLIIGLKYTGTQLGQGGGGLFINNNAMSNGYGLQFTSGNTGTEYLDINLYDDANTLLSALDILAPGGKYLIALNVDNKTAPTLIINQTIYPLTNTKLLSSLITIAKIGSLQSDKTNLTSIAGFMIYGQRLSDTYAKALLGTLNSTWSIYAPMPVIEPPSILTGIVGGIYTSPITILNASTVHISANAGSNWSINNVDGSYVIKGNLPATLGDVTITIVASNAVNSDTVSYTVKAVSGSGTPIIHDPDVLSIATNVNYYANIRLENTTGANVTVNTGSNWSITRLSGDYWAISGVAGSSIGTYTMTIDAFDETTSELKKSFNLNVTANNYIAPLYQIYLNADESKSINLINEKEYFDIQPTATIDSLLIRPKYYPFRGHTLTVEKYVNDTWVKLILNIDYKLIEPLVEVNAVTGLDFYNRFRLLKPGNPGAYRINGYVTYGSIISGDYDAYMAKLANEIINDKVLSTAYVANVPNTLPVQDYLMDNTNTLGWGALVTAVNTIAVDLKSAIANGDLPLMIAHMVNKNAPHKYSKSSIGLSNVVNYPPVNDLTFANGSNASYMTPYYAYKLNKPSNWPMATLSTMGIAYLNNGQSLADATDSSKALTYQGLINLINANYAPWNGLISNSIPVQIKPWPPSYPCYFNGYKISSFSKLIHAIEAYYHFENLNINTLTGTLYIPKEAGINSINLTSSSNYSSYKGFTAYSLYSLPTIRLI